MNIICQSSFLCHKICKLLTIKCKLGIQVEGMISAICMLVTNFTEKPSKHPHIASGVATLVVSCFVSFIILEAITMVLVHLIVV